MRSRTCHKPVETVESSLFHCSVLHQSTSEAERNSCSTFGLQVQVDFATFRFSFIQFIRVKGNFVLILALASNNLSVFSPQGPTEGCGVIPVKGRRVCIDPDPGGYHASQGSLWFTLQFGFTLLD